MALEDAVANMSPVSQFFHEMTYVDPRRIDHFESNSMIFAAFTAWCNDRAQMALEDAVANMSPVSQFFHEMTYVDPRRIDHFESNSMIFAAFTAWCNDRGIHSRRPDGRQLGKELTKLEWKTARTMTDRA